MSATHRLRCPLLGKVHARAGALAALPRRRRTPVSSWGGERSAADARRQISGPLPKHEKVAKSRLREFEVLEPHAVEAVKERLHDTRGRSCIQLGKLTGHAPDQGEAGALEPCNEPVNVRFSGDEASRRRGRPILPPGRGASHLCPGRSQHPSQRPPERCLKGVHVSLTDYDYSDRKSTRLNSSHGYISYAVFCLKKKKKNCRNEVESIVETIQFASA